MNAVSSSAFRNRRLHKSRVLAVAFHHGHRCSKSNQLLRTNEFLSRAVRSSCAMLHHSNLGLHLDSSTPHNKFRTSRPVLHPASIIPDSDLQPFSHEFSCHDDFLHAVKSRTWCAWTSMPPNFLLHRAALGTAHPSWMLCSSQRAVVQWFECVFVDILGHTHPSLTNLTQH